MRSILLAAGILLLGAQAIACEVEDWRIYAPMEGSLILEGTLKSPPWPQKIFLKLYDGDDYLGNGDAFIKPIGTFAILMMHVRMPSEPRIAYGCE